MSLSDESFRIVLQYHVYKEQSIKFWGDLDHRVIWITMLTLQMGNPGNMGGNELPWPRRSALVKTLPCVLVAL